MLLDDIYHIVKEQNRLQQIKSSITRREKVEAKRYQNFASTFSLLKHSATLRNYETDEIYQNKTDYRDYASAASHRLRKSAKAGA